MPLQLGFASAKIVKSFLTLISVCVGGEGVRVNFTPSCWFSLNNLETVRAVIMQHSDFVQNSDGDIVDFQISGQPLMKENCPIYKTSDDTDMKLGPVIKIDKRNKATSKKLDDNGM